jgi:hypothetical protein
MVETDTKGIPVPDGEDDFCLRWERNSQTSCDDVHPAVGTGETISFPGGKGLPARTPDGCAPNDITGFKT